VSQLRPESAAKLAGSPLRREAAGGGSALGLVSFKQSKCQTVDSSQALGFGLDNQIEIDAHDARMRRMKTSVLTASRLHTEQMAASGYRGKWAMVTLTYRSDVEWSAGHIRLFTTHIREFMKRRGVAFRFVWVAELQARGAVHYHLLVLLPKGLTLPKPDKKGWWPHGSTRIEWVKTAVGYISKYASKGDSGFFPKACRIHGSGGLVGSYLNLARWWKRPKYVRDAFPYGDHRVVRASPRHPWLDDGSGEIISSGWLNLDTGEHVESEWFYAGFIRPGVFILRRKPPKVEPSRVIKPSTAADLT